MQTNDFPPKYFKQIEEQVNKEINEARRECLSATNNINNRKKNNPLGEAGGAGIGSIIGLTLGFFVCAGKCISGISYEEGFGTSLTSCLIAFGIIALIGGVLGYIADFLAKDYYKKYEAWLESRVEDEKNNLENRISDIHFESGERKKRYYKWFEETSNNMSPRFAGSEITKEVADWMLTGFYNAIDAADRRSHIEKITVPFAFCVFNNKITCNIGTYDFELKRCDFLENPLQQTALARAIATEMELQTHVRYPNDQSGNPVTVQLERKYFDEYVSYTVTYEAENGNFERQRKW